MSIKTMSRTLKELPELLSQQGQEKKPPSVKNTKVQLSDENESALREASRKHGRLMYDCFNTMVFGKRVFCPVALVRKVRLGNAASDGSLGIEAVFRGLKPSYC